MFKHIFHIFLAQIDAQFVNTQVLFCNINIQIRNPRRGGNVIHSTSTSNILKNFLLLFCSLALLVASAHFAQATVPTTSSVVIADSEEPFARRIYSYDIKVDDQGNVHIVYSKPTSGRKSNVYYAQRINGTWMPHVLVTADAYSDNKCTFIEIRKDGTVFVCFTKDVGSNTGMYFKTIVNGVVGAEKFVYEGGWWGRMQLADNGSPFFVSGGADWPNPTSRLILYTTSDGTTWDANYLNLPSVTKFQIGDFLYEDGVYHITYGGSEHQKLAWNNKAMTEKVMDTFHDLHYVTSTNGVDWDHHLIDNSRTLRNIEFWTKLVLDEGRPLIAMYKYNEYGNKFNRGTAAQLSEWTGSSWIHKIITNQIYPDTNEGMGVGLVVNAPGDYFGAWDFSPSYPQIIPGSPRGNTGMRRSGENGRWENVVQLDPFSLEGRAKFQAHNGSIFFLALGDYTNTKLYFREFSVTTLNTILPSLTPWTPGQGSATNILPAVGLLLNH